ncbi:hypothetical protein JL193_08805 [Polaribacter batillariae]|uniref:Lipoprotein n=1 Tax=Polaribacter batillariae TaxID=2808900 RepID=A0ABX7SPW7_9FLAO|nr:hypothetical protein [Polaribacter batillariae]QTD36265.1 hypothetical protein JL193_08805 [Polaribacter batillariae]
MNKFICALSFLIFVGCGNDKKKNKLENAGTKNQKKIEKKIEDSSESLLKNSTDYKNTVFETDFTETKAYNFSNLNTKDQFTITIPKGKISETESSLTIKDAEGNTILKRKFATEMFVSTYALENMKSYKDVINHIKENVKNNLDSNRIFKAETSDLISKASKSEFLNYNTFLDSKKSNLPIYDFKLSNEMHDFYIYSKKEKRAVVIFNCC